MKNISSLMKLVILLDLSIAIVVCVSLITSNLPISIASNWLINLAAGYITGTIAVNVWVSWLNMESLEAELMAEVDRINRERVAA